MTSKSISGDPTGFQPDEWTMNEVLLNRMATWRNRVVAASEGLASEGCGCRQEYVAKVRRLAAIIGEAPGL